VQGREARGTTALATDLRDLGSQIHQGTSTDDFSLPITAQPSGYKSWCGKPLLEQRIALEMQRRGKEKCSTCVAMYR